MNKIICIGECALDIVFENGSPAGSMPGGHIALAAARLAHAGLPVVMASEASADPVGDMLIKYLGEAGVDCSAVDRFTQGHSPVSLFTPDAEGIYRLTRYEAYGNDGGFDIVWPRVDDSTVVVYGGYYALDARMRERLSAFLNNCKERKCVMVYVPGFRADRERRMTRVMPAILENLELADVVIARNNDLSLIFGTKDDSACYRNHIDFYCRSMVSADTACHTLSYYSGKEVTTTDVPAEACESMLWNSGIIAGVVSAIYSLNLTPEQLDTPTADLREKVLKMAADEAIAAARSIEYEWQQKI
ncbi:MAG: hypothetical protein K2M00_04415 [Muribaculaceae bacterium]|nr:hypothetical protein [Muribaculaceae bacterium]